MADSTQQYVDLTIINGDIWLNQDLKPMMISGRASVAQDIKHMIIESNILIDMVAERNPGAISSQINRLILMTEQDYRIIPGTVNVTAVSTGDFYLSANTVEGPIELALTAGQ